MSRLEPMGLGFSIMDPMDLGSGPATLEPRNVRKDGVGSGGVGPRSAQVLVHRNRDRIITRMYMAVAALFGIFFAVMMVIVTLLAAPFWVALIFTLLILLLQWWGGPWIIRRLFKIRWLDKEAEARSALGDGVVDYIKATCVAKGIDYPRLGIVEDDNPNAFTFGRTRNDAHLVITRGIKKYCDDEETKAVVAHEMGHIVNNDFVIMTIVAAIPLILYVLWRGLMESMKHSHGDNKAAGYLMIVAVVSYLAWLISQYIALCVSRFREYYADDFAARSTGDANKLSTALVKVAYGMTVEMNRTKEEVAKDKTLVKDKTNSALMFSSSGMARAFALGGACASGTYLRPENVQRAMEWDERNVWARLFELEMTHPLTSKRIKALSRVAQEQGKHPFIDPDTRFGPMLWGDFGKDVAFKYSWAIGVVLAVYFLLNFQLALALISATAVVGVLLGLYFALWVYPMGFDTSKVSSIGELILDPSASPVRGRPVTIRGKVVGRGVPGLVFNEDLKLDDGTGIMLLDYHQVSHFLDFFIGLFKTEEKLNKEAEVQGWFRRGPVPYLEVFNMRWTDDTGKERSDHVYTMPFILTMCVGLVLLGIMMVFVLPFGIVPFVTLSMSLGMAVFLAILAVFRTSTRTNEPPKGPAQQAPQQSI